MWLMPEMTRSRFTVATSSFFSHGWSRHYCSLRLASPTCAAVSRCAGSTSSSERMKSFASALMQSHSAG